jgi:hypothetical protein
VTESPGPGWILGTDGNWHTQPWDYNCLTRADRDLDTAMMQAWEEANKLGRQGWEMIGTTMHAQEWRDFKENKNYVEFYVACFFKRPGIPVGFERT